MIHLVQLLLAGTRALVRRRSDLGLENLALRQKAAVLAASGRLREKCTRGLRCRSASPMVLRSLDKVSAPNRRRGCAPPAPHRGQDGHADATTNEAATADARNRCPGRNPGTPHQRAMS